MKITLYDAVNPLAFGKRISDDPALVDWWRDHAPKQDHKIQIISRRDASDMHDDDFRAIEHGAFNNIKKCWRRGYLEELLRSYSPERVCETLFARGVPRDWDGIVMLDHETQAWKSVLHDHVYLGLAYAVLSVFTQVRVMEYAGIDTQRIGPSKEHDWRFECHNGAGKALHVMPCMYVPESWLKLTPEQVAEWTKHAIRHTSKFYDIPVLSPIIEGTHKGTDYSTGQPVPVWLMTQVIRTLADLGFKTLAVWGATADAEQAGRTIELIQSVIVPAVDAVEGGK